MDDILTVEYKGKVYTLKELMEDSNEFSNSLKFFKKVKHSPIFLIDDIGYIIAIEKINQLYNLIASSRFGLIEAHKKLHKSPIEWKSGYVGQLWLRSQYLKNSIVWYNSCLDYVYQIIWFAFEFSGEMKTGRNYRHELTLCNWKSISDVLKVRTDENSIILYNKLNKVKKELKIINTWANSLKHHGSLNFKELRPTDSYLLNFTENFNNVDIIGKVLDIDETCVVLKNVHVKLVEFIDFIVEFIDFDNMFEKTTEGDYLTGTKYKSEYKKIIINNI